MSSAVTAVTLTTGAGFPFWSSREECLVEGPSDGGKWKDSGVGISNSGAGMRVISVTLLPKRSVGKSYRQKNPPLQRKVSRKGDWETISFSSYQ